MRTTVDIDDAVLQEIKRLQKREGKSLGRLVSDLLAIALHERREPYTVRDEFRWTSRAMGARVDLEDRDAVLDALDDSPSPEPRARRKTSRG